MKVLLTVLGFYYKGKFYKGEKTNDGILAELEGDVLEYAKEKGFIKEEIKDKEISEFPKTVRMFHKKWKGGREFMLKDKKAEEKKLKNGWRYSLEEIENEG